MTTAAEIKAALDCGRAGCSCRQNGKTHCPVASHADRKPSFSVAQGDTVPVIVNCHGACSQDEVIDALRAKGLWSEGESAELVIPSRTGSDLQLVAEYEYPGIAVHGRFEDGKGWKQMPWRRPDGTYENGLGDLKIRDIPLFNAHLLKEYPDTGVVVCEGEKAATCATEHRLIAVSLPGGAGQRDFGAALDVLKERDVWLWPDNDKPGREFMRRLKEALPHARFVSQPSDLPDGADAVEYFAAGHSIGALFVQPLRSRSLGDFLSTTTERRPDVVAQLADAGLTDLFGNPGEGKTLMGLEVAATKATGISRIGLTAEPGRVLFVQADMSDDLFQSYARDVLGDRAVAAGERLRIWMTEGRLSLDDPESAGALFEEVREFQPELVILDYFGALISSDGFGPKELRPALDALAGLRRLGVAVLVLDQTRKQGTQSRRGDRPPRLDELYGGRPKSALLDRAWHIAKDPGSNVFTLTPAKDRGANLSPLNLVFGLDGWQRAEGELSSFAPAEAKVLAAIAAANTPPTRLQLEVVTHLRERSIQSALQRLRYLEEIQEGPRCGTAKTYMIKAKTTSPAPVARLVEED